MAYKNLHSSWFNFKLYCLNLSKTSRRRASVSQYVLPCITIYILKETKRSRESLVLCMCKIDTKCLELPYELSLIKRSNTENCHYFIFVNRKVVWIDEKGRKVGWTRKRYTVRVCISMEFCYFDLITNFIVIHSTGIQLEYFIIL